jgi:hypothetical protein
MKAPLFILGIVAVFAVAGLVMMSDVAYTGAARERLSRKAPTITRTLPSIEVVTQPQMPYVPQKSLPQQDTSSSPCGPTDCMWSSKSLKIDNVWYQTPNLNFLTSKKPVTSFSCVLHGTELPGPIIVKNEVLDGIKCVKGEWKEGYIPKSTCPNDGCAWDYKIIFYQSASAVKYFGMTGTTPLLNYLNKDDFSFDKTPKVGCYPSGQVFNPNQYKGKFFKSLECLGGRWMPADYGGNLPIPDKPAPIPPN